MYRGVEYSNDSCPQIKLELAVPDTAVDRIVSLVCGLVRTNDHGDGKVFVSPLDDIVRVRTGEHGERALSGRRSERVSRSRSVASESRTWRTL
jgi:nitrogen regulatory protein P-II 1